MMVALGLESRSTFILLSSSMDLYEHFSVWASEKLPSSRLVSVGL